MDWMTVLSADKLMLSFLACFAVRESMILFLPDQIAGPGGWLVNTATNED